MRSGDVQIAIWEADWSSVVGERVLSITIDTRKPHLNKEKLFRCLTEGDTGDAILLLMEAAHCMRELRRESGVQPTGWPDTTPEPDY